MRMTSRELAILMGGVSRPKMPIRSVFARPREPSSATNPMATTMVGMTKGTVDTAFRTVLPGNSRLAKRWATGRPTASVRTVEAAACHIVNQMRPQ